MRVRYIGPGEAVLAGAYLQHGEWREVTPAQLIAAQIDHPDGFVILDAPADAPASPAPLPTPLPTADAAASPAPLPKRR